MSLKFRLKGLAETFIDSIVCPACKHDGGEEKDEGFSTELTRVTFDGIIVVVECQHCNTVFVPSEQRHGIINSGKLRRAVEADSVQSGEPVYNSRQSVELDVEKMNALRNNEVH